MLNVEISKGVSHPPSLPHIENIPNICLHPDKRLIQEDISPPHFSFLQLFSFFRTSECTVYSKSVQYNCTVQFKQGWAKLQEVKTFQSNFQSLDIRINIHMNCFIHFRLKKAILSKNQYMRIWILKLFDGPEELRNPNPQP